MRRQRLMKAIYECVINSGLFTIAFPIHEIVIKFEKQQVLTKFY